MESSDNNKKLTLLSHQVGVIHSTTDFVMSSYQNKKVGWELCPNLLV